MRNFLTILFAVATSAALLTSCGGDSDSPTSLQNPSGSHKVRFMYNKSGPGDVYDTTEYFYNESGRIKREVICSSMVRSAKDYYYETGRIIVRTSSTNNTSYDTIFLNEAGLLDYRKEYFWNTITKYFYENNYLIKTVQADTIVFDYEYESENLIRYRTNSFYFDNTNYEYHLDKLNTIGNENFGKQYLGRSSKNLVSQIITANGNSIFTYKYDEMGRVTWKNEVDHKNDIREWAFVYY